MKKLACAVLVFLCIMVSACGNTNSGVSGGADSSADIAKTKNGETNMYQQISQEEAKRIMDSREAHIVLDTREQHEFDAGHIPGALLIPYTQIEEKAEAMLPDKDMQILVYCRSGRRSKIASESLAALGYTNVKEFGGINDWKYDIVKE